MNKIIHFDDFMEIALEKYCLNDVLDYSEHYQNLLTIDENMKLLKEFINL